VYVILLKFSENKGQAAQFMEGHNDWISRGFDEGVFLLVGSLQPGPGGGIVAFNISREELERRVKDDPFVRENVVTAELIEIAPAKTDERLGFLLDSK